MSKAFIPLTLLLLCLSCASDSNVVVLTTENFDSVVDGSKTVFVKFFAPWCAACKSLAPVWEEFAKAFAEEEGAIIAEVDATREMTLAKRFDIKEYPTIKFYRAGGTNAVLYHGDLSLSNLVSLANDLIGAARTVDGSIDEEFGTVFGMKDKLSKVSCEGLSKTECIDHVIQTVIDPFLSRVPGVEDFFVKCRKYYKSALSKLKTDGEFLVTETKRLGDIIGTGKLNAELRKYAIARKNILAELQKGLQNMLNKSVSDEL